MDSANVGEMLVELAFLLALTYGLAGLLARLRIPGILAALLVAMAAYYTPLGARLTSPELHPSLELLADIGVLFLLCHIGLQIDLPEMRKLGGDILWCTFFNTSVPFVLGVLVMLGMGYGALLAFVIGLTRMPTAEAVVVPILDEFGLIETRVGRFIIGAGTLDDVIEIFVIAVVSVWIGEQTSTYANGALGQVAMIVAALAVFVVCAVVLRRWLIPWATRWVEPEPRNLLLLTVVVLFGAGGFTEFAGLGLVLGAITAGILLRPPLVAADAVGQTVLSTIRTLSYGFLGLLFFFWVGLSVDLGGLVEAPLLAILLYLAGTVGKIAGVFVLVPMGRLTTREAWTVGIGLDARLTTEIIVAKLLLDAGVIDAHLFTALVSAASVTALTVPLGLSILLRQWGDSLRAVDASPHAEARP